MLRRYEELRAEGENYPYTAVRMLRIKAVSTRLLIRELSATRFFHRQHFSVLQGVPPVSLLPWKENCPGTWGPVVQTGPMPRGSRVLTASS